MCGILGAVGGLAEFSGSVVESRVGPDELAVRDLEGSVEVTDGRRYGESTVWYAFIGGDPAATRLCQLVVLDHVSCGLRSVGGDVAVW